MVAVPVCGEGNRHGSAGDAAVGGGGAIAIGIVWALSGGQQPFSKLFRQAYRQLLADVGK
jgi:hypothetical protein